jgi:hypothetical protein
MKARSGLVGIGEGGLSSLETGSFFNQGNAVHRAAT